MLYKEECKVMEKCMKCDGMSRMLLAAKVVTSMFARLGILLWNLDRNEACANVASCVVVQIQFKLATRSCSEQKKCCNVVDNVANNVARQHSMWMQRRDSAGRPALLVDALQIDERRSEFDLH